MNYDLSIDQHNIRPHLDIERDIQTRKDGLFTFTLRVNQGQIEDYAYFENITYTEYDGCEFITCDKQGTTYHSGSGDEAYAVRPDQRERGSAERNG